MINIKKLAIIGAGASGLCAAIEAKRTNKNIDVTLFDKMQKAGKKILATGNGRCNFSNKDLSQEHFYGDDYFINAVLSNQLSDAETFFRELGVLAYTEDGRLYPRSQQAATIRECLVNAALNSGVSFVTDTSIDSVIAENKGFIINGFFFDAVIICGGGKAAKVHGSDGSCYRLLTELGHTLTELRPALCGFNISDKDLNVLKGVRAEATVKLYSANRLLGTQEGEIQFTDKAVSGIPVMNLSHLYRESNQAYLEIDFCSELPENGLFSLLQGYVSDYPHYTLETIICGFVNSKIAHAVLKRCGRKETVLCNALSLSQIAKVSAILKCFKVNIKSSKGFDSAQVTCGGIKTRDFNPATMMSTIKDGVYACGEILDIHGDCGGYNLHLAWATGRIAGKSAANYLG